MEIIKENTHTRHNSSTTPHIVGSFRPTPLLPPPPAPLCIADAHTDCVSKETKPVTVLPSPPPPPTQTLASSQASAAFNRQGWDCSKRSRLSPSLHPPFPLIKTQDRPECCLCFCVDHTPSLFTRLLQSSFLFPHPLFSSYSIPSPSPFPPKQSPRTRNVHAQLPSPPPPVTHTHHGSLHNAQLCSSSSPSFACCSPSVPPSLSLSLSLSLSPYFLSPNEYRHTHTHTHTKGTASIRRRRRRLQGKRYFPPFVHIHK